MYKILIKHKSTTSKTFWKSYEVYDANRNIVEFSTTDLNVLKEELNKLDKQIGYENIRVVNDVDYNVLINIADSLNIATPEDIEDIYSTAFNNVFG